MPDENIQVTGKLKGIENDGIIILTDEGKKPFSVQQNVIEHLHGKMVKRVTVKIPNNIVIGLEADQIKPNSSGM